MLTIGGGILMLSHLHKKRGLQEGHKRHVPVLSVASVIIGSTELVTSYGFCGLAYWQGQHAIAYTSTAMSVFAALARAVATGKTVMLLRFQAEGDMEVWIKSHKTEAIGLCLASWFFYDNVIFMPWVQDPLIETELLGFPNTWTLKLSLVLVCLQTLPALVIQLFYFIVNGKEADSYAYFSMVVSFCAM